MQFLVVSQFLVEILQDIFVNNGLVVDVLSLVLGMEAKQG